MKIFNIYARSSNKQDIIAIKDGFCLEAFIFGPIWAFYKKMWIIGLVPLALRITFFFETEFMLGYFAEFLDNLILLMYGFLAYDFLDYKLCRTGYKLEDVIIANNQEEAELTYLRKNYNV